MPSKPIIGIILDHQIKDSYSAYPWYALRENYVEAVQIYGGMPLIIPYSFDDVSAYIEIIDGLLIPGGDFDIPPQTYGEQQKSDTVSVNIKRSEFELKLTKAALEKDMPILGICGGEQLINVLLGGTLIQHIPDEITSDIEHTQKIPKHLGTHRVKVEKNTLLARITERESILVNSTHHQAVKKPANDVIVCATAADGVIEAIEHKHKRFCLGVQWHPEYLTSPEDRKIFQAFINASNERKSL